MTRHDFANLRRSHGSQRAVAKRIGVGFRTLQRIEAGTIASDDGSVPEKYANMMRGCRTVTAPMEKETREVSDWIEWSGGKCPVDPDARVSIQLRMEDQRPDWSRQRAGSLVWEHRASLGDIIAYRVVSE